MQHDLKKLSLNQETMRNMTAQLANSGPAVATLFSCSCRPQCETTNTIHCFGERPGRKNPQ
jgi:hypothetical protein